MIKLLNGSKTDKESIHKALQKGYGIEHPERISGYVGFFFNPGDVYVSDGVAEWIKESDAYNFILESLKRFEREDYGHISESDKSENAENRWLWGTDHIFGRYGYKPIPLEGGDVQYQDFIKIRFLRGNTFVLFDSEMDDEITRFAD